MIAVVPEADHAGPAFVSQDADGGGLEGQPGSPRRGLSDPARGEHAQQVAMGDEHDVTVDVRDQGDHRVSATSNRGRVLAPGAAITPQRPSRTLPKDLRAGHPLVVPVVPLGELGDGPGGAQSGELARLLGTLQGADQDLHRGEAGQRRAEEATLLAPGVVERDVAAPGVAPAPAPFRLTVARQDQPKSGALVAQRRTARRTTSARAPASETAAAAKSTAISGK